MMNKQASGKKVSFFLLSALFGLIGCESHQAESPEQERINTMVDNVKAVEKEEHMEQTDGDYLDQSTLANPHPKGN